LLTKSVPFHIVDVFTDTKYSGNQLAVVRNANDFSEADMQKFAREMNFSETSFILLNERELAGNNTFFPVRIFTPRAEVPFAGHPTLGTAFVIQQYILRKQVPTVTLDLKVGPIEVTPIYEGDNVRILWMKQNEPTFGPRKYQSKQLAKVLGLSTKDILTTFPIQEVSTGLLFLIVPLKNLRALKRCSVNREKYFEFIKKSPAKAILVFSPGSHGTDSKLSVRMFSEYYGVPEDPATGSGNGGLAAYLSRHEYFGSPVVDIQVDQGYEIGRPSTLHLKATPGNGKINVMVGGQVVPVAEGILS
jgi:trans-2,3-dihydro-3-hydroxyanthranilate isomerase